MLENACLDEKYFHKLSACLCSKATTIKTCVKAFLYLLVGAERWKAWKSEDIIILNVFIKTALLLQSIAKIE